MVTAYLITFTLKKVTRNYSYIMCVCIYIYICIYECFDARMSLHYNISLTTAS